MSQKRHLKADPRSVARDIAGIFTAVFPQLVTGLVIHLNRTRSFAIESCQPIESEFLARSTIQRSMLFELASVVAEGQLMGHVSIDWNYVLNLACDRQRQFYDADLPTHLSEDDKAAAIHVGNDLARMLVDKRILGDSQVTIGPEIPGYRWISNGIGDFADKLTLVEVKCSSKRFSTADYRQILLYWLLDYIDGLEKNRQSWKHAVLLNPRTNTVVKFRFGEVVQTISAGKSIVDVVEAFSAIVADADG